MIKEDDITRALSSLLGSEVSACRDGDRYRVLTPMEYPDGDGVVVRVEPTPQGRYVVTDGGATDAVLTGQMTHKSIIGPATAIASRLGLRWDRGHLLDVVDSQDVADACWRVAQAAAAVAEGATFHRQQPQKDPEFVDVIARQLRHRKIPVEADRKLEGASGHVHTASLFVPPTETVIEAVTGEREWNTAMSIYVEFGDLRQVNGYRFVAIVDDRETPMSDDIVGLLSQVADVASWREHDQWIAEMGGRRLSG